MLREIFKPLFKRSTNRREFARKMAGLFVVVVSLSVGYWWLDHLPPIQTSFKSQTKTHEPGAQRESDSSHESSQPQSLAQKNPPQQTKSLSGVRLRFLKDWSYSKDFSFNDRRVGGLSAMAMDQKAGLIWALSDDRGKEGPPRLYRFRFETEGEIQLELKDEMILKDKDLKAFKNKQLDPEGLALFSTGEFLVASEGDRAHFPEIAPRLLWFNSQGKWLRDVPIPLTYYDETKGKNHGVSNNMAFESLTMTDDERWLYLAPESTLMQDGSHASFEAGALVRIQEFDREQAELRPTAQLVYETEPISHKGYGLQLGINSLSELIAVGQRRFLALERAFLWTSKVNIVRLFEANCLKATEVDPEQSLKEQRFEPCSKTLVWESSELEGALQSQQRRVDNLEGMTLLRSKDLSRQMLLMVSDNNFNSQQFTQFLLFELKL